MSLSEEKFSDPTISSGLAHPQIKHEYEQQIKNAKLAYKLMGSLEKSMKYLKVIPLNRLKDLKEHLDAERNELKALIVNDLDLEEERKEFLSKFEERFENMEKEIFKGDKETKDIQALRQHGNSISNMKPVNILEIRNFHDKRVFYNNLDVIKNILLEPEIKDRKIVIVSIVDDYNRRLNLIRDYCLRILYKKYSSVAIMDKPGSSSDCKISKEALSDLSWKHNRSTGTKGIFFWPDVFLHNTSENEKIAIVLMDTQGLFEDESTQEDDSRIFGLSTLISSIQITIHQYRMGEEKKDYDKLISSFGKKSSWNIPFINFSPSLFEFGSSQNYNLNIECSENFRSNQGSNNLLSCTLKSLITEFSDAEKKFNKKWSQPAFAGDLNENIRRLIKSILKPKRLIKKSIKGTSLTCAEYHNLIWDYLKVFQDENLPTVDCIAQLTIKNYFEVIIDGIIKFYQLEMEKITDGDFSARHSLAKNEATEKFQKLGLQSKEETNFLNYKSTLEKEIENNFEGQLLEKGFKIISSISSKVEARGYYWIPGTVYDSIPIFAVIAGHNDGGSTTYVGRILHKGFYCPVNVCLDPSEAHFFWKGKFIKIQNGFDFLICPSYEWVKYSEYSKKAYNAIPYGTDSNRGLIIARTVIGRSLTLGEFEPIFKDFALESKDEMCKHEILTVL